MSRLHRALGSTLLLCVAACGGRGVLVDDSAVTTTASSASTATSSEEATRTTATSTTLASNRTPTTSAATTITTTKSVSSTTPSAGTFDPALQALVDAAVADLAERLGVEANAITVVSAEAVVWPDGALGCPQPGMVYTQVQVEGARIILSHAGNTYVYHSGGGDPPFLCEKA